jgi:ribosomal protein S18 acetylase RimI-like enzyme
MITYEWSDWRDGDFWWIQSVYVAPEARRRGVFRALYRHVEAKAREARACGLRLYVEGANANAQATYRGLGMSASHYELYEIELPRR